MDISSLLLATGGHQIEAAETLIAVGRFIVILFAARALAELMVRFRLPAILGELVAGVLISVSGLHLILAPELGSQLNAFAEHTIAALAHVDSDQVQEIYDHGFSNLQAVAKIGLLALLFLTGLESELDELMAVGGQAITVALTGVVLPFALGTFGLQFLFGVPLLPAIFAGAAMTATSIGITASVLGELKFLRTREGQTVIGAAVLDDILGIVILAVVVALAGGEGFSIGPILKLIAAAAVFVVVALFLSRTAAPPFDWLLDRLKAPGEVVVAAFLVMSLACFAAQAFGLEAALGAFAGGLILSGSRHRHAIEEAVKPLVAPVRHGVLRADRQRHGPVGAQPLRCGQPRGSGDGRLPAGGRRGQQGGGRLELPQQRAHQPAGGGAGDDAPGRGGPDLPGPRHPDRGAGAVPGGGDPADGDGHHLPGAGAAATGAGRGR